MRKNLLAAALVACAGMGIGLGRAEAKVCGVGPEYVMLAPAIVSHTLSLGTATVGLLATKARPGWRNAAIAHAGMNIAQAAALVAFDAFFPGDYCAPEVFGRLNPVNLAVEGTVVAGATALLLGAIIWADRKGPPPATVFVAPLGDGWRAGLAMTF